MNAPFLRPLGCPLGVDPFQWREAVEARIERLHEVMIALITALDTMDSDTDLEPSLGLGRNPDGSDASDDREGGDVLDEGEPNDWDGEDGDADEANGDLEPSLGGLAVMLRNGHRHQHQAGAALRRLTLQIEVTTAATHRRGPELFGSVSLGEPTSPI